MKPLETFASVLVESRPSVCEQWIRSRPEVASSYLNRLASFQQNRRKFPSRWTEETQLFVPFAGLEDEAINALSQGVHRALLLDMPEELSVQSWLQTRITTDAEFECDLYRNVSRAVHSWAVEFTRARLADVCSKDARTLPTSLLARAHWVMLRGAVQRWANQSAKTLLRSCDSRDIVRIEKALGMGEEAGVKNMRIIYDWDLRTAIAAWRQSDQ